MAELKAERQAVKAALAEKQSALEKAEQTAQKAEKSAKIQIAKQMLQANAQMTFIMQVTGLEEDLINSL